MTSREQTLILGGTGKTGSRVSTRLRQVGRWVRLGSRAGTPPFDWADSATWEPALGGATSAYLSYYPDLAVPGAAETVGAFTRLATDSGVRRVVLLSGRGEPAAQLAEQLVQAAGAAWTVVRSAWFDQNFSEGPFADPLRTGELALPVEAEVCEPFVDADDVAEGAAAALLDTKHAGQVYEVTGPRLLTFSDAVAEIASATRRDIGFTCVALTDFSAGQVADGVPDDVTWLLSYLFSEVFDGRNAHRGDGVQRALGREPREFHDYARQAALTDAWAA